MSAAPLRKVLIISPHFPPINAPDAQRARMALPYLRQFGWEPVVLAVTPECVEGGVRDPLLESTYPPDVRIIRVRGLLPRFTRWAGIGSLWWRCGPALRRAAEALLRGEHFDLVLFTTTQFDAFTLGPVWRRRYGVPFMVDYQDPWVNDYYRRTRTRPPGGWIKFSLSQAMARRNEPRVLRDAAGIIAVSSAYGPGLAARYPWFAADRVRVLPFGAAAADLEVARRHRPAQPLINFADGNFHLVYAGRCGPDMTISLTTIFRGFRLFLDSHPDQARRMRFHFIGTDYAPPPLGRMWAMPVAKAEGIADYVSEHCYRVPYFDALHYLLRADALIAVGSNDPSYSASKIFPYILAQRPMLVVFHHHSLVLAMARQMRCGVRFSFGDAGDTDRIAAEIHQQWFVDGGCRHCELTDPKTFEPFTSLNMTRQLAGLMDEAAATRV